MAQGSTGSSPGRRIRGLDADQRRARRREQLLDAGLDQFAAHGYHNTSIEQICRVANVSTKSFYESFESREACYLALLQRTTAEISSAVVERMREAPADEEEATREVLAALAHALVDDPRRARVTFGGAAGISPVVERQRRVNRRWAAGFLERLWEHYDVVGSAPAATVHNVAVGAIGGMFDLIADWLLDADPAEPGAVDELVERLADFYGVVRAGWDRSSVTR